MEAMKSQSPAPAKAIKSAEIDMHESVRSPLAAMQAADAAEYSADYLAAGAASVNEIDKLMEELRAARDYLKTEGERLKREAARYSHLTRTALASVKVISENMDKWRETAPSRLAQVA
jgi:hypothetical protein